MALRDALIFLDRFVPTPSQDVVVRFGRPAYARLGCRMVAYIRAGSSSPGEIVLKEEMADLETAGGLALLAHEVTHQCQYSIIPDLDHLYELEEKRVKGQPPYQNGFERPAYEKEAEVYWAAIAQGYPPGLHVPLLIQDGRA